MSMESPVSSSLWPPAYALRISARAKRLRLQITPKRGLELIVPRKIPQAVALMFLEQHRPWVEKHLAQALYKQAMIKALSSTLPTSLFLRVIDTLLEIEYIPSTHTKVTLMERAEGVVMLAKKFEIESVKIALGDWLKKKAPEILIPLLESLSVSPLSYHSVNFRSQRSMWGSCSADKKISLNYNLLFLPKELVRYVIIHELCHTIYLDHSFRFWNLVQQYEPHYQILRKQLKKADRYLPAFLK